MSEGSCSVRSIETMEGFRQLISNLRPDEALMYGVPNGLETARIVTKAVYDAMPETERQGTIARCLDHFKWHDGPGIFMIDYDPEVQETALRKDELLGLLNIVAPELQGVPKVWWPSSSSHICTEDGKDLTGLRGQRIYIPVRDARTIPRLSETLEKRFWASGYGYIRVSKSGQCLKRTPIDHAVYQPNRLDFAAGASTGKGLVQMRGLPELLV